MVPYDFFMLAVFGCAAMFGAFKGLAWQIASLASFVVSYLVALAFGAQLAPHVSEHAPWNKFLAMLILYTATSLIIWTLFRLVAKFIDRLKLQEFDRQLGAIAGGAKGLGFCIVITFFAVGLTEGEKRQQVLDSKSGRLIGHLIERADAAAPPEMHDIIGPYLHKMSDRFGNDPLHANRPETVHR